MSEGARKAASSGPYDAENPDTPNDDTALDLGVLRLPVPDGAQLRIAHDSGALHLQVPSGQLSLSVLTAPRSAPLWPGIAEAITSAQGNEGAVCEPGEWGPEIQTGSYGELSWFIGADGPGWLLYGVASGPAERSAELVGTLRELFRSSVVRRGSEQLPPRTVLPLLPVEPAALRQHGELSGRAERRGAGTGEVTVGATVRGIAGAGWSALGSTPPAGAREPMEPVTSPHPLTHPLPVTAPWHPSYHGTPQRGAIPADTPLDSRPDTEPAAGGPLRPLASPTRRTGSDQPRHSAEWPAWLDNPFGPDPSNDGRHAAAPPRREPEPAAFQQQLDTEHTPRSKRRVRAGLIGVAATLILLLGAGSVLMLTHGTEPYTPSPTSAALPEPDPSTALSTAQAPPPGSMPGVPAFTPPVPAPNSTEPNRTRPNLAAGVAPGSPSDGSTSGTDSAERSGRGGPGVDGALAAGRRIPPHRSIAGGGQHSQAARSSDDAGPNRSPLRSHHTDHDGDTDRGRGGERPDGRHRPHHPDDEPEPPLDLLHNVLNQLSDVG
jgi:hypothetical protein